MKWHRQPTEGEVLAFAGCLVFAALIVAGMIAVIVKLA